MIIEHGFYRSGAYNVFVSSLCEAEKSKKAVKIYRFHRNFIDKYKAIDKELPPIIIKDFFINGSLIYSRKDRFNYLVISFDEIRKIEIQEV